MNEKFDIIIVVDWWLLSANIDLPIGEGIERIQKIFKMSSEFSSNDKTSKILNGFEILNIKNEVIRNHL